MTDKLIHRGPDAEGHWVDDEVALGHRRLSIIDLDARSDQPMVSHDKRFVLVFNGEIYDHIEIRQTLSAQGVHFKTNSDTEVIIEAYRKYGTECFNKFNGMWALALYDLEQRKLILCRDRFGIKPLYTLDGDRAFAFASEMKAIIAAFPDENIPNGTWIYRYLSFSQGEDTDEQSAYKNIKIFPQAQYMIYDLDSGRKEYKRYWEIDESIFYDKWIRGKDPIKVFRELFESAIGLRLRADVEIGACLSGGLDSSSIVGCVARRYGKKVKTFSSIYEDKDCNEEMYINKVNKKWGTIPHHVRPDDHEGSLTEYIEDMIYHHDQPAAGATLYSSYCVMKAAQGKVKVLLDGQGADELFAGYPPYFCEHIYDLMDKGTFWAEREAKKAISLVNAMWPKVMRRISTDIIVRLVGIENSFLFKMDKDHEAISVRTSSPLFTDSFIEKISDEPFMKSIHCSSRLNTRCCNDLMYKSIPKLLHNEDGNSMAFSIESRVPFLDYRIVEFAIALENRYKIRGQWTKWIVRKACRRYLPKEVARRKNKMGFPAPFARWLREGKSKDEIAKVIYDFGNRDIVPKQTIDRYYKAHIDGKVDLERILFRFYSMELWLRMTEGSKEAT